MDRESGNEVGSVRIRFKAGRRRAVLPDGPQDLGNTRAAAFREIQFLEKFADPPVPVATRHPAAIAQILKIDGTIRSGIAGDGLTARRPEDEDMAVPDHIRGNDRMIGRLDPVSQVDYFLLDLIDLVASNACGRQERPSVFLLDADKDVATAQIVKIIGEGAQRMENGLGIPAFLKFQPFPFDGLSP